MLLLEDGESVWAKRYFYIATSTPIIELIAHWNESYKLAVALGKLKREKKLENTD